MLSSLLVVAVCLLVAVCGLLVRQMRRANRDIETLFRLRAAEIERATQNPADAAAHAVDRHVSDFHKR